MRAVLNGKMDLIQAEAVRDFVEAQTFTQARTAMLQIDGALSRRIAPEKRELIDIIARLEAGIDFAEDDITVPDNGVVAAEIDQIPWLKRIWYVILPNGKFILMLGILLRTIDAFKTTDLPYLMTNGGPGNRTEFVGLSLYRKGFEAFQVGEASSLAIVTLLIAIAFASIYLYVLSYRETRAQLK